MKKRLLALLAFATAACSNHSTADLGSDQPAPSGREGQISLSIRAPGNYTVDILDPVSLEAVVEPQTVASGTTSVKAPFGHWRVRVRPQQGQGLFHGFAQVHPGRTPSLEVSAFSADVPRPQPFAATPTPINQQALDRIKYFIIVYMENQSYDATFPYYPGGDGIDYAGSAAVQNQLNSSQPIPGYAGQNVTPSPSPGIPVNLASTIIRSSASATDYPISIPAGPLDLVQFVPPTTKVGDTDHLFVKEQRQINGGKMDQFSAWSSNPGVAQGHYNLTSSPLYTYAQEGVLCDRFFHSAFGDTWLNEFWFISGATPIYHGTPPADQVINLTATSPQDKSLNRTVGMIGGTAYMVQFPPPPFVPNNTTLQTYPTIGDRLDEAGVDWRWYGADNGEINPFIWFANTQKGSPGFTSHIKWQNAEKAGAFLEDLQAGKLPPVSFVRPNLDESLHPDDSTYDAGQAFLTTVVGQVKATPAVWNNCAIIITTDENGGRWDHVAPPPVAPDGFGPGTRIPTVIVSPFVQAGTVDHNVYETVSILKTLQLKYNLASLSPRVDAALDLSRAFSP